MIEISDIIAILKRKKESTKDEVLMTEIVDKYLNKDRIERIISPLSDEYLFIDNENEIYMSISDGKIMISNHSFLYKKDFYLSFTDKIKKTIRKKLEEERQARKKILFNNETDLLTKIRDNI